MLFIFLLKIDHFFCTRVQIPSTKLLITYIILECAELFIWANCFPNTFRKCSWRSTRVPEVDFMFAVMWVFFLIWPFDSVMHVSHPAHVQTSLGLELCLIFRGHFSRDRLIDIYDLCKCNKGGSRSPTRPRAGCCSEAHVYANAKIDAAGEAISGSDFKLSHPQMHERHQKPT